MSNNIKGDLTGHLDRIKGAAMNSTIITVRKDEILLVIGLLEEKLERSAAEQLTLSKLENLLCSMMRDIDECNACWDNGGMYETYCFAGAPNTKVCCMCCTDECSARCESSSNYLNMGGIQ